MFKVAVKNIIDTLKERCLFDNMTSEELYTKAGGPLTVYAGFDPSSDSLQIGNYVTIMVLAHFQRCGHRVIAVAGGATGLIGDPSGKSSERNMLSVEQVEKNLAGIRENLSRFLDFKHPTAPAKIVNNYDWLGKFSFVEFLRDVGKHFRMGAMLGKESVRSRLDSEGGMSFAEFSYQLLQAYDFLKLYDSEGCVLQVGGSDQWGNITAGTDLIRKLRGVEAYGLTVPLVCDSAGRKFGKSEGNAVYLAEDKTSCYDFYQYFFRTEDADVIRYLKILTFLPLSEIAELEKETVDNPNARTAQKRLAEEVTRTVHGEECLRTAQKASSVLFGESLEGLNADQLLGVFSDVPSVELSRVDIEGTRLVDVATSAGLCRSKSEARRLVESGGFYINNRRVTEPDSVLSPGDIVDGRIIVFRSGKKNVRLVKVR